MNLVRAVKAEASGIFNCTGDGTLRYSEVVRAAGKRPWPLPAAMIYSLTELFWKLRLSAFPPGILGLIRHPWAADTTRLKTVFGYTPNAPRGRRWMHFSTPASPGGETLPRRSFQNERGTRVKAGGNILCGRIPCGNIEFSSVKAAHEKYRREV
jgi:UDP-glucose 4-epimerase